MKSSLYCRTVLQLLAHGAADGLMPYVTFHVHRLWQHRTSVLLETATHCNTFHTVLYLYGVHLVLTVLPVWYGEVTLYDYVHRQWQHWTGVLLFPGTHFTRYYTHLVSAVLPVWYGEVMFYDYVHRQWQHLTGV